MTKLVDQYGKPIQRDALYEPQTSRVAWLDRTFADHPSRGLSPVTLHQILEDAERGNLEAQSDLFVDMEEKDGHIYAEMSKRKRVLLTVDWRVEPVQDASEREKRQAAEIEEWLRDVVDMENVMLDALDAIGHGFSAQEIEWQQLGGHWLPKTITHRPQRWFRTPAHDGNDLRLRDHSTDGEPLWPLGWIVHKHKARSGYLTRSGLHRVLVWPYLFKNYAVRDFAEFLEIYGLPLRLGKYPAGATAEEKMTLLRAVAGIGHDAAGIIPDGMLIEFQDAARGAADPFVSMRDWCERLQSKAILGGTLTSGADGAASTNALGNVHNEVRHDLKMSDARQLAKTLTTELIYPLMQLNFGQFDQRRCCRLIIDARDRADLKSFAESIPALVNVGMPITVSWMQEKLGIPAPVDGEPVLTAPAAATPFGPFAAGSRQAALSSTASLPAEQRAIVEAEVDAAAIAQGMGAVLKPIIDAVRGGQSLADIQHGLYELYPQMDDAEISEMIARAMFVADIMGRING